MRFAISILGTEVFEISTEPDSDDEKGDAMSNPIGFVASAGDQAWQPGVER